MDHTEVRKLRTELGVSQAELARATGINRTILSGYETGQLTLEGDCARRLADFFAHQGVDRSQLERVSETSPQRRQGVAVAAQLSPETVETIRTELREIERQIRTLEQADCEKGFFDGFMERDKEEREALLTLLARWRVLVLTLEGHDRPVFNTSEKPVSHADALARAYLELRDKAAAGS